MELVNDNVSIMWYYYYQSRTKEMVAELGHTFYCAPSTDVFSTWMRQIM